MPKKLTESLEDYLEAIAELIEVEGHAHTKEIARKLNVKMPSVTAALRQLLDMGCIVYNTHYPVQLTEAGREIADRVIRRHAALKEFFLEILGLPVDAASETACKLEHIVNEDAIERFLLFTKAIGTREDAKALKTHLTEAMELLDQGRLKELKLLSEIQPGTRAEVVRIGRNVANLAALPFSEGDALLLQCFSLDKTSLTLAVGDRTDSVALSDAENVWVRPLPG